MGPERDYFHVRIILLLKNYKRASCSSKSRLVTLISQSFLQSFILGQVSCLVVAWPSVPQSVQDDMANFCVGWKRCIALFILKKGDSLDQHLGGNPPTQLKFSLSVAWILIKSVREGFIVRLSCGQKMKQWMLYNDYDNYASR